MVSYHSIYILYTLSIIVSSCQPAVNLLSTLKIKGWALNSTLPRWTEKQGTNTATWRQSPTSNHHLDNVQSTTCCHSTKAVNLPAVSCLRRAIVQMMAKYHLLLGIQRDARASDVANMGRLVEWFFRGCIQVQMRHVVIGHLRITRSKCVHRMSVPNVPSRILLQ